MQQFEIVERLSLQQKFELVKIAHQARDREVREAALSILRQHLHPMFMVAGDISLANQI